MLKVLLVDDEQIILNGLQRVISWEKYGCEVIGTAVDGKSGMELIRRLQPDIVLTDIRMPNMDGLTMIAAIKSEFPDIQVSILTAYRDFEYAQRAIRLGVARYLLKPSKMEELKEAIGHMARLVKARPELPEEPGAEAGAGADESEASAFILRSAQSYMRAHFQEHIRLVDVADSIFVSQWHLSKLINRTLNKSFYDLLNDIRIEEAKRLLPNPGLKVHEIAQRVGFSDVAHFSKTFKRLVGQTPGEFRAASCGK